MTRSPATWRFFDFLARRVLAVLFAVGGAMGAVAMLPWLFDQEGGLFYRLVIFLLPVVLAVVGVLMYRAPPYGPPGDGRGTDQNQ